MLALLKVDAALIMPPDAVALRPEPLVEIWPGGYVGRLSRHIAWAAPLAKNFLMT
jgi:hypothetical protein